MLRYNQCMKNIILAIMAIFLVSQASMGSNITASTDDAKTINATNGKAFTIKLLSNPTTGYTWKMEIKGKNKISLEAYEYRQSRNHLTGSGGEEQWHFKALQKGEANIHFFYARPWEKNIPPVDHKTFKVIIK